MSNFDFTANVGLSCKGLGGGGRERGRAIRKVGREEENEASTVLRVHSHHNANHSSVLHLKQSNYEYVTSVSTEKYKSTHLPEISRATALFVKDILWFQIRKITLESVQASTS